MACTLLVVYESHTISLPSCDADTRFLQTLSIASHRPLLEEQPAARTTPTRLWPSRLSENAMARRRTCSKGSNFLHYTHIKSIKGCWQFIYFSPEFVIYYLLYGTTGLEQLWKPSNEGFFIWFNFSYTYFLIEADWWVISPSLHEPTKVLVGREYAD